MPHPAILIASGVVVGITVGLAFNEFVLQPWREQHQHEHLFSSFSPSNQNQGNVWSRLAERHRRGQRRRNSSSAEDEDGEGRGDGTDEKELRGIATALRNSGGTSGLRNRRSGTLSTRGSGGVGRGVADEEEKVGPTEGVEMETLQRAPDFLAADVNSSSNLIFSLSPSQHSRTLSPGPHPHSARSSDFSDAFAAPTSRLPHPSLTPGPVSNSFHAGGSISGSLGPHASASDGPADVPAVASLCVAQAAVPPSSTFSPSTEFSHLSSPFSYADNRSEDDPFSDAFTLPSHTFTSRRSNASEAFDASDASDAVRSPFSVVSPSFSNDAFGYFPHGHHGAGLLPADSTTLIFPTAPSALSAPSATSGARGRPASSLVSSPEPPTEQLPPLTLDTVGRSRSQNQHGWSDVAEGEDDRMSLESCSSSEDDTPLAIRAAQARSVSGSGFGSGSGSDESDERGWQSARWNSTFEETPEASGVLAGSGGTVRRAGGSRLSGNAAWVKNA